MGLFGITLVLGGSVLGTFFTTNFHIDADVTADRRCRRGGHFYRMSPRYRMSVCSGNAREGERGLHYGGHAFTTSMYNLVPRIASPDNVSGMVVY